jgi:hypothetical protein
MKLMDLLRESFTYVGSGHDHKGDSFKVWKCNKCHAKLTTDDDKDPNKSTKHKCHDPKNYQFKPRKEGVTEAQVDSPGTVMAKAQLAKVRADASQLGQKQKTLAQSKKNTKDTPTKRRLSKQIADLGVKKADLGVRSADMSQQLKKKNVGEAKLNEWNLDPDMEDAVLIIAKNERKFYEKWDAKGAVEFAIKEYLKERISDIKADLEQGRAQLVRELMAYWKRERR